MQHVRNSWNFQDFHKVRAKDPQAWSRPWNFVKGWPTGAVDWSTVKCLSRIFSNLSMISKYRLKITRLNAKDAKDWLQHHTKQQLLIVHWTIFHIMKIEVFKNVFLQKKSLFSLDFASHSCPSGCAPQLAGRWSSSAAERSAGVRAPSPKRNCRARSAALAKSCGASEASAEMLLFVEAAAQTKRLQISF